MSQHQQAFLTENASEVARVARQVLSILASGDPSPSNDGHARSGKVPSLIDLAEQLYTASYDPDPAHFEEALCDVQRAGHSSDVLTFELIPSIARHLGASWEGDMISFTDVTIGCARLQSALRRLPDDISKDAVAYNGVQQNCLVMVPAGAQHTMGALVLAKQLRRARQRVVVELEADTSKLSSLAQKQDFNVALISASVGESPQNLRQLIRAIRQHWTASKVVVGGSFSNLDNDSTNGIGADHVTKSWQEALDLCI